MQPEDSLRERLVEAGVQLVQAEGVSALGLREIARRAGVSHGAPRRYFPTHAALLSAIARRGFIDLARRFTEATGQTAPPRQRLRAMAHAYLRFAGEHRGMFELMFRHDLLRGQARATGEPPLRDASLPLFARIVELVDLCPPGAGARRRVPAQVTAVALWANVHGLAELSGWGSVELMLGEPDPPPTGDRLDRLITEILDAHLGQEAR
ncbi:TetR family transcriptional regulator [Sphaerisporangium rufum]|uniref:TetR family transcriptional regulator n=1 Tax=Sphaerisporangium rufum TaxID=1381558 RepID=A0A919V578_9ACTN|nr:TetR/AcrR family transcriptional regulator [Sphaerisporangium rufum]GII78030.1 TetR family transcriptional regulator [Sphaerisporangium rufum]